MYKDMNFHEMSIDELVKLKREIEEYLEIWYGYTKKAKDKRTPEWIEAASKRLEGQTDICCECGDIYPKANLVLRNEIYCETCNKEQL